MYEIIDPLSVVGATIDRTTGVGSSPNIRRIDALGFNAFEGFAILPNGVTYYGNELAAEAGEPGGAYYKFVPTNRWTGGPPITDLDDSPYSSGSIFALRVGTSGNNGQGFQYDLGSWQSIAGNGALLLPLAAAVDATGYYRPEDIDDDTERAGGRQCPILQQQHRPGFVSLLRGDDLHHRRDVGCLGERQHSAGSEAACAGPAGDQHARQHRLPVKPSQLDHP